VDLWGELRRATEAAQAELLGTEAAYRNVTITLVSDVAGLYLLLRDLDERLQIARRTLETRLGSLKIIQARFDKGTVPELDVNQAQIEVAVAESAIATFERQIVQTENALRILLGRNPGSVSRGQSLEQQRFPPDVPAGLPSELLQRRPDVVQAEAQLEAATARIGVAEALRYPSIFLTGRLGVESTDLSDLNSDDAETWNIGANIFAPIFNSGQLKAQAEAARARAEEALLRYESTLQQAFREVEDALVAVRTYKDEYEAQSRRVVAARNAARLSRARYDGGVVDYLEVLDTERTKFDAELAQSQTLQLYFNSIVQLYKALGGGWVTEE
jgi:multidrug efflux system outer membrane protein